MTAKLSHPRVLVLAIAGLLLGLVASTLLMASPVHADHAPVHGTILGRAPFADPVDLKIRATVGGRKRTIQVRESAETVVQHIVVQPGGFTGWHTHPGPAVALVVEGSLTLYQGKDPRCRGFEYGPSEAFIDPGQGNVHGARNEGSVPAVVYITYFDVPAGTSPLTPAENPGNCAGF